MSDVVSEFTISVDQVQDYEFRVRFDKDHYGQLATDEPAPLGKDAAPGPSRVLAAAIGSCLSASLLFCSRKHGVTLRDIRTQVKVQTVRNEKRRLRIGKVEVSIEPQVDDAERNKALGCVDLFEDFCTVTQSVRSGIPVEVTLRGLRSE